jgi:hypothetical protein
MLRLHAASSLYSNSKTMYPCLRISTQDRGIAFELDQLAFTSAQKLLDMTGLSFPDQMG